MIFDWYYSSHGPTESQQGKFVYGGQNAFPPLVNVIGEVDVSVIKDNYCLKKIQTYFLFIQISFHVDFTL